MTGQTLRPATDAELCEVITGAVAARATLEVRGGGTKASIGKPGRGATVLNMGAFSGIIDYDPSELVLTAGAATPLSEIERAVAAKGQMLAFEPHGREGATIGGVIAANISGPRRVSAGAPRDHLLGFDAVSGRGEVFKGGGKVVKNVTGYDLPKLMAGSWGRLAVMTRLTVKVLPRPRTAATVLIHGLNDGEAIAAMARAMGSTAAVSAAAHLPAILTGAQATTAVRLEGFSASVAARTAMLKAMLGAGDVLGPDETRDFWAKVNGGAYLGEADDLLWRINVPPAAGAQVITALPGPHRYFYDWAGGLIWLAQSANADMAAVRRAASEAGGHAMLVRAPDALRANIPALHPEAPGVAALSARVKHGFDPADVLDPERFGP